MKKLVFIGNRLNAFYIIVERKLSFESLDVWVLKDSPLHKVINSYISSYNVFTDDIASKKALVSHLHSSDYNLLITNGCPFKLPISALAAQKSGRLHINIHPTYLPELKGKTPLNGVIYLQYDFIGATVHYMTDDIDAGDIIYQEKIQLTEEIDLGLIYFMSFSLEGEVFRKALDLLEENEFEVHGTKQVGAGSTFNRSPELFFPDFKQDKTDLIIRKVRSVGIETQGVVVYFDKRAYTLYDAGQIKNPWLLNTYANASPGDLLLKYSNKLLVKTIDGIVRFTFLKQ